MSEAATEEHVEHVVHEEHSAPASDDLHVGERLGSHDARITALEESVRGLTAAQSSTEEDVERVEEQAEQAQDSAIEARVEASQAEQTAEVAAEVAVAAAEVAVVAEETAEEVEAEVTDAGDGGDVTEVDAEQPTSTEETPAARKRRRGLYGRR